MFSRKWVVVFSIINLVVQVRYIVGCSAVHQRVRGREKGLPRGMMADITPGLAAVTHDADVPSASHRAPWSTIENLPYPRSTEVAGPPWMLSIGTTSLQPQRPTNEPVATLPRLFSILQQRPTFREAQQSPRPRQVLGITACRFLMLGERNRSRVVTTRWNSPTRAAGMSSRISTMRVPATAMRSALVRTKQGACRGTHRYFGLIHIL